MFFEACETYYGVNENGADYKNTASNNLKRITSIRRVLYASSRANRNDITLSTDIDINDFKVSIYAIWRLAV